MDRYGDTYTASTSILVLLFAYSLAYFHRVMTGVMKPEISFFANYYGIDPNLLLSIIASAYFYAYAVAQLFIGPFLDYYGVKRGGFIMFMIAGVSAMVMCIPHPLALVIGRFFIGFSVAVAFVAYMRTAALYYSISSQGKLTSYALMAGNISAVAATYPLRLLLTYYGYFSVLVVISVISFVVAFMIYITSCDKGSMQKVKGYKDLYSKLMKFVLDKHMAGVVIADLATYGTGVTFQAVWGQELLPSLLGIDIKTSTLYLMVLTMVFVALCPLAGYLSDNVIKRRRPVMMISSISSLLGWLALLVAIASKDRLLPTVSMLILIGTSLGFHIVAPVMAREQYGREYSATATAAFNIQTNIGVAVLQNIVGILHPNNIILINIVLALVGVVAVLTIVKETYGINEYKSM